MTKRKAQLSDFRPQAQNANRHTERGLQMLEDSIQRDGWVDAQTVAADGEMISGSARLEVAADKFADTQPIVVESDGRRPIIVKRTDIPNAADPRAKRLAIAVNRIQQVDYDLDPAILAQLAADDALAESPDDKVLAGLFTDAELRAELGELYPQAEAPEAQVDKAAELQEKWQVRTGDLWEIPSKMVKPYVVCPKCGRHHIVPL